MVSKYRRDPRKELLDNSTDESVLKIGYWWKKWVRTWIKLLKELPGRNCWSFLERKFWTCIVRNSGEILSGVSSRDNRDFALNISLDLLVIFANAFMWEFLPKVFLGFFKIICWNFFFLAILPESAGHSFRSLLCRYKYQHVYISGDSSRNSWRRIFQKFLLGISPGVLCGHFLRIFRWGFFKDL